ncbi:hypothetical protein KKJ04_25795, partial [Xenorhabdus bovienii]|uniref:hypothetical protein n=1 Tax=Xenorhabdus bovienii TaxID=40576 RepID=UPI0023B2CADE
KGDIIQILVPVGSYLIKEDSITVHFKFSGSSQDAFSGPTLTIASIPSNYYELHVSKDQLKEQKYDVSYTTSDTAENIAYSQS